MVQVYVLPNGTDQAKVAIKQEIPDCLEALHTNFSGASEPPAGARVAFMLWADTSTSLLKIRNAANTAWIIVAPLAQDRLLQLASQDWAVASLSATRTSKIAMASGAGTVKGLLLVCETATTSSSGNEWQVQLKKYPQSAPGSPVNLFSGTVGTFTSLSGVYTGGEFVAAKAVRFVPNQNATFVDLDVLEVVMTKAGTATTLVNFRALVEVQ
jgi:hypothetical protein